MYFYMIINIFINKLLLLKLLYNIYLSFLFYLIFITPFTPTTFSFENFSIIYSEYQEVILTDMNTVRTTYDSPKYFSVSENLKSVRIYTDVSLAKFSDLGKKASDTFSYLFFIFEIISFQWYHVISSEKTLLNITHDRKGISKFLRTVL